MKNKKKKKKLNTNNKATKANLFEFVTFNIDIPIFVALVATNLGKS
jgi:hypothetical protein